jgi:hypothetical protein
LSDNASSAEPLAAGDHDQEEGSRFGSALGLLASLMLHGALLLLLVLAWPTGMAGSHGELQFVPVEIVAATDSVQAPSAPSAEPSEPSLRPAEQVPAEGSRPPDELGTKLRALSQLRQPGTGRPSEEQEAANPRLAAVSDDAEPGRLAGLKDFIRVQVERHWSLNLAALGTEDFSIPIRIWIDKSGVVLKADILATARGDDPIYREAAVSARNAVLSASPLSLPPGHYGDVTELVLTLNPKGSLR